MKKIKFLLLGLLCLGNISVGIAQTTLQNGDVTMSNGIITATSLSSPIGDLIIPETLQGQTVTGIGQLVFTNKGITSLELPSSLEIIGYDAFNFNTQLDEANFEDLPNLETIEHQAFANCDFTSLDLSNCTSLTSIGRAAFHSCEIVTVKFPGTALSIGPSSFKHNDIEELEIGDNIIHIGGGAFNGNNITVFNDQPSDGIIYAKNPDGSFDYTKTTSYGRGYFGIGTPDPFPILPVEVEEIGESTFANTGIGAIAGSPIDLTNLSNLRVIGKYAFEYNSIETLDLSQNVNLEFIGEEAFGHNTGLSTINFTNVAKLDTIGINAFTQNGLSEIDLQECTGLIFIGFGAFYTDFGAISAFELPEPNVAGNEFLGWYDNNGTAYASFDVVDVYAEYRAVLNPVTAVEEVNNIDLQVVPTIVTNTLTVNFENEEDFYYSIIDVKGQEVKKGIIKGFASGSIDVSSCSQGIYNIIIYNNSDKRGVSRFIKN